MLGTDLPALTPRYGLRVEVCRQQAGEWEFLLLNLCVSVALVAPIHLCLAACNCLWADELCCPPQNSLLPPAPLPAPGLPSWLSPAATLSRGR